MDKIAPSQSPNVIYITSHDIGRHLGCYDAPGVCTLALDRLAAEGLLATHAFATSPICSPARSSLATGRFPHSNGVKGLAHPPFEWDLDDDEIHLASLFKAAGYSTQLCGLQHECQDWRATGIERLLNPPEQANMLWANEIAERCEFFLGEEAKTAQPFYLQIGFFEPHRVRGEGFGPYVPESSENAAPPPWLVDDDDARGEFAKFNAAILALDSAIGRILQALSRHGLSEDTLIIFVSDHGLPFPRAKGSLYDPGLEISLLARFPRGHICGGMRHEALVSGVDLMPTILDLAGLPIPEKVQGRSLAKMWRTGASHDEPIFAENNFHNYWDPIRCIRTQTHKLIMNFGLSSAFYDTSQQWQPKTRPIGNADPRNSKHPPVELYDLIADPLEQNNLAELPEHQGRRGHLIGRLAKWMQDTEDPLLSMTPLEPRCGSMQKLILNSLTDF